jgi:hypothetical protein
MIKEMMLQPTPSITTIVETGPVAMAMGRRGSEVGQQDIGNVSSKPSFIKDQSSGSRAQGASAFL